MSFSHRWVGDNGLEWACYSTDGTITPPPELMDHGYDEATWLLMVNRVAHREILNLASEVSRLKAWQDEQLAVESSWDAQAVAKLLGVPLGGDIRKAIQPAIERLKAEAEKVRAETLETVFQECERLTGLGNEDFDDHLRGANQALRALQEFVLALLARQDAPLGVTREDES